MKPPSEWSEEEFRRFLKALLDTDSEEAVDDLIRVLKARRLLKSQFQDDLIRRGWGEQW